MSKSKSSKYKKPEQQPEEQAQELIVDVSRETSEEFIPDGEIVELKLASETNPFSNETLDHFDKIDESKVVDPKDPRHVDYKEDKGPHKNMSAKRQTYQEIMADRAKAQKELVSKNIERNRAIQAAQAKRFQEGVDAKKAKQ